MARNCGEFRIACLSKAEDAGGTHGPYAAFSTSVWIEEKRLTKKIKLFQMWANLGEPSHPWPVIVLSGIGVAFMNDGDMWRVSSLKSYQKRVPPPNIRTHTHTHTHISNDASAPTCIHTYTCRHTNKCTHRHICLCTSMRKKKQRCNTHVHTRIQTKSNTHTHTQRIHMQTQT